jgi:probable DNA metabolism protein
MIKRDIVLVYDGSLECFFTCLFECFKNKEEPFDIIDAKITQPFLQPVFYIKTDIQKAKKVYDSINSKLGQDGFHFIRNAFFSCVNQKEMRLLHFILRGYKYGPKVFDMIDDENVLSLTKAVKFLINEARLLSGFIRFSDYDGILAAEINPKNQIFFILAPHFIDRMPRQDFLIYDQTHKTLCAYIKGKCSIYEIDEFQIPQNSLKEEKYKDLWKKLYDSLSIKERENLKLRQNNLPKRYWKNMVEMERFL